MTLPLWSYIFSFCLSFLGVRREQRFVAWSLVLSNEWGLVSWPNVDCGNNWALSCVSRNRLSLKLLCLIILCVLASIVLRDQRLRIPTKSVLISDLWQMLPMVPSYARPVLNCLHLRSSKWAMISWAGLRNWAIFIFDPRYGFWIVFLCCDSCFVKRPLNGLHRHLSSKAMIVCVNEGWVGQLRGVSHSRFEQFLESDSFFSTFL